MNPQLIAILNQAIHQFQAGNLRGAESLLTQILQLDPSNPPALQIMGLIKATQGNLKEAAKLLKKAVKLNPNDPSLIYNLAKVLSDSGDEVEAIIFHEKLVKLAPNNPGAWLNYSKSLANIKKFTQSLVAIEKVILIDPNNPDAWNNQGAILKELGRLDEAVQAYKTALKIKPNFAEAQYNLGIVYAVQENFVEAIQSFDRAIEHNANYYAAYNNKGVALTKLMRYEEALTALNQSLQIKASYIEGMINKAIVLTCLKKHEEALKIFESVNSTFPNNAQAWNNKGYAHLDLNQYQEAIYCYEQSLALDPDSISSLFNIGQALINIKQLDKAVIFLERAAKIDPDHEFLAGLLLDAKMQMCDWDNFSIQVEKIKSRIQEGKLVAGPFTLLSVISDESIHLQAAELLVNNKFPSNKGDPFRVIENNFNPHEKIRVGYFSADFHNHATSFLMAELFELHNKGQFEIFAFSFGPDIHDEMRARVSSAFKEFIDVRNKSDLEIAEISRNLNIQIAVDLKGFTQDSRAGIFANRAAPIQISYLGYPGTMGADFMDYIIADPIIIPEKSKKNYSEKVLYLPNCYQPNDTKKEISVNNITRTSVGLPEDAFVFCCFNNNYKITPIVFKSWMHILGQIEGSVLWLFENNSYATENLRKSAKDYGIHPDRLIFAQNQPLKYHLARYALADLFLDTSPYNAHTTASDALWMGLPIITITGDSFAGRVASSLLHAVGLPELITKTWGEYEALAIDLASNSEKLSAIQQKLLAQHKTSDLFNTKQLTQDLEKIYQELIFNL